ncbi:cytochrome P450 [Mycena rebaudengoi]|nr:cytochrome P450 [Mycena rebaudengoi]
MVGLPFGVTKRLVVKLSFSDAGEKKAQREIDAVVRTGHIPNFDDKESLSYVSVIVKEVLRWWPVTPIAVPHFVAEEDMYRGYRIPAGSIVIPNTWAMLHDEVAYPSISDHRPVEPRSQRPRDCLWVRTTCLSGSAYSTIASLLAVFDINKAI